MLQIYAEVLAGVQPPFLKFLEHLTQMRPVILPNPLGRDLLLPRSWVEYVLMVRILVVCMGMRIVIPKNVTNRLPRQTRLVAVRNGAHLPPAIALKRFVDIKEEAVLAVDPALYLYLIAR